MGELTNWDTTHEGYRAIFMAALTGYIANKDFHGPISQGNPRAAVEFANQVFIAAIEDNLARRALRPTTSSNGGYDA